MNYGPWATELGARLIGLKFKNYLTLEAWRLQLAAFTNRFVFSACRSSGLTLGAWALVR